MTLNPLYQEAEDLLNHNQFAEAVAMYRLAMETEEPHSFINFNIARELEMLEFIRQLKVTYPDSFIIQLEEAWRLRGWGHSRRVIQAYTDMLHKLDEADTVRTFRVRMNRFFAACDRNEIEIALEDFDFLWQNSERERNPSMLRAVLLIGIMNLSARNVSCLPILRALQERDWLPQQVQELITVKTKQMVMVQDILRAAKQGNFPAP